MHQYSPATTAIERSSVRDLPDSRFRDVRLKLGGRRPQGVSTLAPLLDLDVARPSLTVYSPVDRAISKAAKQALCLRPRRSALSRKPVHGGADECLQSLNAWFDRDLPIRSQRGDTGRICPSAQNLGDPQGGSKAPKANATDGPKRQSASISSHLPGIDGSKS